MLAAFWAAFVLAVVAPRLANAQRAALADVDIDVAGYSLRALPEGGYLFRGERFSAVVAPDGRVTFHDRRVRVIPGGLGAVRDKGLVAESEDDLQPDAEMAPPVAMGHPLASRPGDVGPPPSYRSAPIDTPSSRLLPLLPPLASAALRFDLTDEFLRAHGQDPYRREKADFCSATFEFRVGLAQRNQIDSMRLALSRLPDDLNRIWNEPRLSPAERRDIVFALWRETSDSPDGQAARAIIEDFIRSRLTRRSPCR